MYEQDIRHIVRQGTSEEARNRLRAFRRGWNDALRGQEYQADALQDVKWQNLGWRFGRALGDVSSDQQESVFEVLADLQVAVRAK